MGTILIGLILTGIVISVIVVMIKDKKAGKSIHCGCDCKNCSGHCNN